MSEDTLRVHASLSIPDRERVLDWLTGLLPAVIIAALYYRWAAVALAVTAVGGYMLMTVLLSRVAGYDLTDIRLSPALFGGLLAAFCLPAGAPWWLSAFVGGVTAAVELLPLCVRRVRPTWRLARPWVSPVLTAYLLARVLVPYAFFGYTVPAQFASADAASSATPLAAFGEAALTDWWRLLFGVHAGAVGETCAVALLLCGGYLMLRRRLRLIAPASLLATVALLSWLLWGAPAYMGYALLSGGLLLGALLFADKAYAPSAPRDQMVVGCVAGIVTVLVRAFGGWAEGVSLGVVAAQLLAPVLPTVYVVCGVVWRFVVKWTAHLRVWIEPRICRLWTAICRGVMRIFMRIKKRIRK